MKCWWIFFHDWGRGSALGSASYGVSVEDVEKCK